MDNHNNVRNQSQEALKAALLEFQTSDTFREYPLQIRAAFHKIIEWLPDREASCSFQAVTASFARMLRDKAARERGWKFGNHTLVLLQTLVGRAVETGALTVNRVKQVPKLSPPSLPASTRRRRLPSIRRSISSSENQLKKENNSG